MRQRKNKFLDYNASKKIKKLSSLHINHTKNLPDYDVIGEIAIYFLFFSGGFDCFADFVRALAVGG